MNLWGFLKHIVVTPKPCQHRANFIETTWLGPDDTPMASFSCLDCGWRDRGHVHADPRSWPVRTTVVENGEMKNG